MIIARTNPKKGKRLGRPPATDSGDTRRRILDIARAAFATGGYDASTNRELAAAVGITAGALYHYFGSKLDLYLAVHADVQALVYSRFTEAVESAEGFLNKFEAVLDTAHEMNRQDPTLAAFLGVVRSDMRRHPEINVTLRTDAERRDDFFVRLVDVGVANGEIAKANRLIVIEFIRIVLVGLTDGVSDDTKRHKRAINSVKSVMRGQLLVAPDS
ncbi:MAG: AcrR family transcriptional regulator [Ilumatobacter sp.]|jgi:AcrR family transcriptional regulator|tara:strand:- start:15242 stop:15886 length:645 start_codon:yes stop_codon:yes gene_type:complete